VLGSLKLRAIDGYWLAHGLAHERKTACKLHVRNGLENRYPSLGGSRVRIPPPPHSLGSRFTSDFRATSARSPHGGVKLCNTFRGAAYWLDNIRGGYFDRAKEDARGGDRLANRPFRSSDARLARRSQPGEGGSGGAVRSWSPLRALGDGGRRWAQRVTVRSAAAGVANQATPRLGPARIEYRCLEADAAVRFAKAPAMADGQASSGRVVRMRKSHKADRRGRTRPGPPPAPQPDGLAGRRHGLFTVLTYGQSYLTGFWLTYMDVGVWMVAIRRDQDRARRRRHRPARGTLRNHLSRRVATAPGLRGTGRRLARPCGGLTTRASATPALI